MAVEARGAGSARVYKFQEPRTLAMTLPVGAAPAEKFVPLRRQLEVLAVQSGTRSGEHALKLACCQLVLDDGDGTEARHALEGLREWVRQRRKVDDELRAFGRALVPDRTTAEFFDNLIPDETLEVEKILLKLEELLAPSEKL